TIARPTPTRRARRTNATRPMTMSAAHATSRRENGTRLLSDVTDAWTVGYSPIEYRRSTSRDGVGTIATRIASATTASRTRIVRTAARRLSPLARPGPA